MDDGIMHLGMNSSIVTVIAATEGKPNHENPENGEHAGMSPLQVVYERVRAHLKEWGLDIWASENQILDRGVKDHDIAFEKGTISFTLQWWKADESIPAEE